MGRGEAEHWKSECNKGSYRKLVEDFPGGSGVKTLGFHCRGPGLNIPGLGTKILQVTDKVKKKKRRSCAIFENLPQIKCLYPPPTPHTQIIWPWQVLIALWCGIQFPDQGWNLGPVLWEHGVLGIGPPGKLLPNNKWSIFWPLANLGIFQWTPTTSQGKILSSL